MLDTLLVLLRFICRSNLFGYYEIADIVTCIVMLLGFISASSSESHISVDFLNLMQDKRIKIHVSNMSYMLFILMCGSICLGSFRTMHSNFISHNTTFMYSIPIWILDLLISLSMITTIITLILVKRRKNNIIQI